MGFEDRPLFARADSPSGSATSHLTMSVPLNEGTNEIDYVYPVARRDANATGEQRLLGLVRDRSAFSLFSCYTPGTISDGTAIRFVPVP